MWKFRRKHKLPKPPKVSYPNEYRCLMVINHPDLETDLEGVRLKRSSRMPKEAIITHDNKISPILIHMPDLDNDSTLTKAEGVIEIKRPRQRFFKLLSRTQDYTLGEGWYFLTPAYIYNDSRSGVTIPQNMESTPLGMSPKEYINAIARGEIFDTLEDMGPYQLGADLEMQSVKRQLRKHLHNRLAANLYGSIRMLTWCVFGALILFGVILATK